MAIIKVKKLKKTSQKALPKLPEKTETPLAKIVRLRKEKEADAIKEAKQKELDRVAEEKRMEKLVIPYLDHLQEQIVEKELLSFWTFPDEPGFKKIKNMTVKQMQAFINKNIDKYKNRNVALISISFNHHDKPTSIMRKAGFYFALDISIFPIDKHGILNGADDAWGADISWKLEDFKTTKFSFKLLETILNPVAKRVRIFTSLLGFPATYVIDELKKIKIKFDKVLKPLPGALV